MTNPNEELPVSAFFENDQSIGLIAVIDREHGNIKTELLDKTDLSDKSLKNLLDDAIAVDLIEEVPIRPGDHPRSTRYQLTKRGKSVQSLLRLMGLDKVQREYIARKQKLNDAIPDVKVMIEEEGLHEKYMQKDYWSRLDHDAEELERKQLIDELKNKKQDQNESQRSETKGSDEYPVDIVEDDQKK